MDSQSEADVVGEELETGCGSDRGTAEVPTRDRKQQLPDAYQYRACVLPDPLN